MLILPYIMINLLWFFDYPFNVGWVITYIIFAERISYWIYYWTARGPVILRISSTYQFHSYEFLLPIRFLRNWDCIWIINISLKESFPTTVLEISCLVFRVMVLFLPDGFTLGGLAIYSIRKRLTKLGNRFLIDWMHLFDFLLKAFVYSC